ncbi:Transcriptional regulator, TetR family [Alloactinosynnema sp. L-07]|uniref:TetR/AcrR family transcriptional regulator n=1 Tax=Alloactinosynnema sp. L-07 TaxID=1653480 RepID=UPI00065EF50A|nr:TetR/AcrR family transcriptional regulator [Alloactinosynnema sp. L-07]CRK58005.1 Transcriptional regulator, TetR family [Alloactinosynnema sp. L-07]
MSSRREDLLDAAISVVGEQGVRALTHRAVDAAARVPAGSTSNYFRTKDALLDGVVERVAAREMANWGEVATRVPPTSPAELVKAVEGFVRDMAGIHRVLVLARHAILIEAAQQPRLRELLAATGQGVTEWFTDWLRAAGSSEPERDAPIVMNHVTGLVLHQLAIPDPSFGAVAQVAALIEALLEEK